MKEIVISEIWKPQRTKQDPYAPDPVTGMRTKKQQYQIEEMRKDRAAFVKKVTALASRGGPTDLISACKIATGRKNIPDIRALPELEVVVKTAAKYMNREELFNLIHEIRRNDQGVVQTKSLNEDDVEVVELFANGTCAYAHFRGGNLSLIETMSKRELQRLRRSKKKAKKTWMVLFI